MEKLMANVSKYAENLAKKDSEVSHAFFELGQSLTGLSTAEKDPVGYGFSQVLQTTRICNEVF
jgi:hypothetical protein